MQTQKTQPAWRRLLAVMGILGMMQLKIANLLQNPILLCLIIAKLFKTLPFAILALTVTFPSDNVFNVHQEKFNLTKRLLAFPAMSVPLLILLIRYVLEQPNVISGHSQAVSQINVSLAHSPHLLCKTIVHVYLPPLAKLAHMQILL